MIESKYSYVAIEGIIGAGKTTLATAFQRYFNSALILETFEDNPFLPAFYKDPQRYAFQVELNFLAARYHQLRDKISSPELFHSLSISDYFIFKSWIFASLNLREDELLLYRKLFEIISQSLPSPELILYLYVPDHVAKYQILQRGRPYEQSISEEYLGSIQRAYLDFLKMRPDLKVLLIDMDGVNLLDHAVCESFAGLLATDWPKGINPIRGKQMVTG